MTEDTYEGQIANPLTLNLYTYVGNNPLIYTDPTGHMMEGDERFKGTSIYSELEYLTSLWEASSGDAAMQDSIHQAADFLRGIGDNRSKYQITRINTFIPMESLSLPGLGTYQGDNRSFDANATSSRTSQYIVVNQDTSEVQSAYYIGTTHKLDDGNVVAAMRDDKYKQAVTPIVQNGVVFFQAEMSSQNPLAKVAGIDAPTIDYFVFVNTSTSKVAGVSNSFPAYEIYSSTNGEGYTPLYQYYPNGLLGPLGLAVGTVKIKN